MSALIQSPTAIIGQIQANLRDRYGYNDGFPLLKELLQNADDAKAGRVIITSLKRIPGAKNPLLNTPGLLVLNDGKFDNVSKLGILSFGESYKATDKESIGRFGFGQKSVFHVCDAFLVFARGYGEADDAFAVNPFLELDDSRTGAATWDGVSTEDSRSVRDTVERLVTWPKFFAMWLPLRRHGLEPNGPNSGFAQKQFLGEDLVSQFKRPQDLFAVLSALRNVRSVMITDDQGITSVEVGNDATRLAGPGARDADFDAAGYRSFGMDSTDRSWAFSARENLGWRPALEELQRHPQWPQVYRAGQTKPEPQKAEPHGAVVVIHDPKGAPSISLQNAVFLPVGPPQTWRLSEDAGLGAVQIVLHGYYFLDSGRLEIVGLEDGGLEVPVGGETAVARQWNRYLYRSVVLPLVPSAVHGLLNRRSIGSEQLAAIVRSLVSSDFFRQHRQNICGHEALVRTLEPNGGTPWRLVSANTQLRPVHLDVEYSALLQLFPNWAEPPSQRTLCFGDPQALTPVPLAWPEAELVREIKTMVRGVFFRPVLARTLAQLLAQPVADATGDIGQAVAQALRESLVAGHTGNLAPDDVIADCLKLVHRSLLFRLPRSVDHRAILDALAKSGAGVLAVRNGWLSDGEQDTPRLSTEDVRSYLEALVPLLRSGGETAVQAGTVVNEVLRRSHVPPAELAKDDRLARLAVLGVQEASFGRVRWISLRDISLRTKDLLIVKSEPGNRLANSMKRAMPDLDIVIMQFALADAIAGEEGRPGVAVARLDDDVAEGAVLLAEEFATSAMDRLELLEKLRGRRLACRVLAAGSPLARTGLLYRGSHDPKLQNLTATLLASDPGRWLVPNEIVGELRGAELIELDIRPLDLGALEDLFGSNAENPAFAGLTAVEYDAVLNSGIDDEVLKRLPAHPHEDGTCAPIGARTVYTGQVSSIPPAFRPILRILSPAQTAEGRRVQDRLTGGWTPARQIDVALEQPDPTLFLNSILDALLDVAVLSGAGGAERRARLRDTAWLSGTKPSNVLNLPGDVAREASAIIYRDALCLVDDLASIVREHPAFDVLRREALPSVGESLGLLGLLLEERSAVRRPPGALDESSIGDLVILAKQRKHLDCQGWPLLAAVLREEPSVWGVHDAVWAFVSAVRPFDHFEADLAVLATNSTASLAQDAGETGRAAEGLYHKALGALSQWPHREEVLGGLLVPTQTGGWSLGSQVTVPKPGISKSHLLANNAYRVLFEDSLSSIGQSQAETQSRKIHIRTPADQSRLDSLSLADLEQESVQSHRVFLNRLRGVISPEAVLLYLGFVGRFPLMQSLAAEWEGGNARTSRDELWQVLDERLKPTLPATNLEGEVGEHLFIMVPTESDVTAAISLSGESIVVPVSDSPAYLIGNQHEHGTWLPHLRITVHYLHIRSLALEPEDAKVAFADLLRGVAQGALSLLQMQRSAIVEDLLEDTQEVNQTTLRETIEQLKERLPHTLDEMKRSAETLREGVQAYRDNERRASKLPTERRDIQMRFAREALWNNVASEGAISELLRAIRSKIRMSGYQSRSVLFELIQNADDACLQLPVVDRPRAELLRVEVPDDRVVRVVHYGRPINHLGANMDEGRGKGHDRDLFNMLVSHLSEKQQGGRETGKFGLGFKSVHLVSSEVFISSDFLNVRIAGGMVPSSWPNGAGLSQAKAREGLPATVIELHRDREVSDSEWHAVGDAVASSLPWPLAFTKSIRHLEWQEGGRITPYGLESFPIPGCGAVRFIVGENERALRFDLGEDFTLLLELGTDGPKPFAKSLLRLWCLTPLQESLPAGWLLNGPFQVDPGRNGLSGSPQQKAEQFERLGRRLGDVLLSLYDAASGNWSEFRTTIRLGDDHPDEWQGSRFWRALFDVLSLDLENELTQWLHSGGTGYAALAGQKPVIPTGLAAPFDQPVCAIEVKYNASQALADTTLLRQVSSWPSMQNLEGSIVSHDVAETLRQFKLAYAVPMTLSSLLERELDILPGSRVDPESARRLGAVLSNNALQEMPLFLEAQDLRKEGRNAKFRTQEGTWDNPGSITTSLRDDQLFCAFAPAANTLDASYNDEAALRFFEFARAEAGFAPNQTLLAQWARQAGGDGRKELATLRYLLEGAQGERVAAELAKNLPRWMPQTRDELEVDPRLSSWSQAEKAKLTARIFGYEIMVFGGPFIYPVPPVEPPMNARAFLATLHSWWDTERSMLAPKYDRSVYPPSFDHSGLYGDVSTEPAARANWFTMFALARLQSMGRTRPEQHRQFVEGAIASGWWTELALSGSDDGRPPASEGWLARLEGWSDAVLQEEDYRHWRSIFVDLYTLARWLPSYVKIIKRLPRLVQEKPRLSLTGLLRPSSDEFAGRMGLEAAPIARSLGTGANWLVRELCRQEFYSPDECIQLADYGWMANSRAIRLLERCEYDGPTDGADASIDIHRFVSRTIGREAAAFHGDFDLAIQLCEAEHYRDQWTAFAADSGVDLHGRNDENDGAEHKDSELDATS